MATCAYSHFIEGPCGPNPYKLVDTACVTLSQCNKDVRAHLAFQWVSDSTLNTEQQLLLARAGIFDYTEDILNITICPRHRLMYGIKWLCPKSRCAMPSWWRPHKNNLCKGDRGINLQQSRTLYILTNEFLPVGTRICRGCRRQLKIEKEKLNTAPNSEPSTRNTVFTMEEIDQRLTTPNSTVSTNNSTTEGEQTTTADPQRSTNSSAQSGEDLQTATPNPQELTTNSSSVDKEKEQQTATTNPQELTTNLSSASNEIEEQTATTNPGGSASGHMLTQEEDDGDKFASSKSKEPIEEEEAKWRMVLSKTYQALYYEHKITGLQKWTTQNCICSKSKWRKYNSPILPCCFKGYSKKITASRKKSKKAGPDLSVELCVKKAYSLSNIVNNMVSPKMLRKRKSNTGIVQQTSTSDVPRKKVKTLWAHRTNDNPVNHVPIATSSPPDSQCNNSVSLATESNHTRTETSIPTDDFFASIGLQPTSKSDSRVSVPAKTVSMTTCNELIADVSMTTQSDSIGAVNIPQSEPALNVTMTSQNDSTSVPMAAKSNQFNISVEMSTCNTITKEQSDFLAADSMDNETTPDATHVVIPTSPEECSIKVENNNNNEKKKRSLNAYNLRSSGEEGANVSQYLICDYALNTSEPKKKKKKRTVKPKRGKGRPPKKSFYRWLSQLSREKNSATIIENGPSTEQQTTSESVNSDQSLNNEGADNKDGNEEVAASSKSKTMDGITENSEGYDSARQQTESTLDSDIEIDVVGGEDPIVTQITESNKDQCSNSSAIDSTFPKKMLRRNSATILKIKAICAAHRKRKRRNKCTSQETSSDRKKPSLLDQSIQELLELEPSRSSKEADKETNEESAQQDDKFLSDIISLNKSEVISPTSEIPFSFKSTSSVSTSTNHRNLASPSQKQISKTNVLHRKLSTLVSQPLKEPPQQSTSNDIQNERLIENSPQPKIQFVSDNNLKSGAVFFTAKNAAPKHLPSVVETLKYSPNKIPEKGSSEQTAAWIDLISEIDTRKRARLLNEQQASSTNPEKELNNAEICSSRTSTASEPSHLLDESLDESLNNSQTFEESEEASVQPVVEELDSVLEKTAPQSVQPQVKRATNEASPLGTHHLFDKKEAAPHGLHGLHGQNLTEVDARYMDLSWRIVTSSNGRNLTSLSHLHKLIPIRIQGEVGGSSFMGIAGASDRQVIAKILNTSIPEKYKEVFIFTSAPRIVDIPDKKHKKGALTFKWEHGKVSVQPKRKSKHSADQAEEGCQIFGDNIPVVQLPKPLKLPESGSKVYLGELKIVENRLEFLVNLVVTVALSPHPSLFMPPGALARSISREAHVFKVVPKTEPQVKVIVQPVFKVKATQTDDYLYNPCHICEEHVNTHRDAKTHRCQHTKTLGLTCSECPRQFFNSGRLSVHLISHRPNIQRRCPKCGKKFKNPRHVTENDFHSQTCGYCNGDFTCRKCSKRCTSEADILQHAVEAHGKPCRICAKKFINKTDLEEHMVIGHQIHVFL